MEHVENGRRCVSLKRTHLTAFGLPPPAGVQSELKSQQFQLVVPMRPSLSPIPGDLAARRLPEGS